MDSTSTRFPIGTSELFCKDFPFVKIQELNGKIGWVSGQFVYKILDKSNDPFSSLVKTKSNFSLSNTTLEIRLGRNYGIPTSYQGDITGCEEYYPVILFDKSKNQYNLVQINNSPNSREVFWNLVSDEGIGEEINRIIESNNQVIFKIKCIYQDGSGFYSIKLSEKDNLFYGESIDYIKTEE